MTLAKAIVTGTVYRKPQTGYSTNDVAVSSFTIDIGEREEMLVRVISKRNALNSIVSSLEKTKRFLWTDVYKSELQKWMTEVKSVYSKLMQTQ